MNRRISICIDWKFVAVCASLFAGMAYANQEQPAEPARTMYEYKFVSIDEYRKQLGLPDEEMLKTDGQDDHFVDGTPISPDEMEKRYLAFLNQHGREGWRLASAGGNSVFYREVAE